MAATDPAERLLNLIIALSNARGRMTRAEIRETVVGYDAPHAGDDAAAASRRDAAFERMFERDKDDLRRMGVPLRTVTDATHGDDIGYVIDAGQAAIPALDFSPAERAVLAVAAEYWQEAALSTDARRGLTKLASSAPRVEATEMHLAARSRQGAHAAPALALAIADGQEVEFDYTSASSGYARRRVQPWRLVVRGGALYLVGHDVERGEPRTYRLSRIDGVIVPVGVRGAFVAPHDLPATQLEESVPALVARIGLRAESGHALRRRGAFVESVGEWDLFDVPFGDTDALRAEVLALGGAARIESPVALAESVVAHARAALELARG